MIIYYIFFFSSRRRHTRCALVTGVQTCALPISEQRKRLLSYIWADQWPRLERVAMALEHAGRGGPPPEQIHAGDFVARELAARPRDAALVLYHSIVWQYVDPAEQQRIAAEIGRAHV